MSSYTLPSSLPADIRTGWPVSKRWLLRLLPCATNVESMAIIKTLMPYLRYAFVASNSDSSDFMMLIALHKSTKLEDITNYNDALFLNVDFKKIVSLELEERRLRVLYTRFDVWGSKPNVFKRFKATHNLLSLDEYSSFDS